jgi:hypothetical protein
VDVLVQNLLAFLAAYSNLLYNSEAGSEALH